MDEKTWEIVCFPTTGYTEREKNRDKDEDGGDSNAGRGGGATVGTGGAVPGVGLGAVQLGGVAAQEAGATLRITAPAAKEVLGAITAGGLLGAERPAGAGGAHDARGTLADRSCVVVVSRVVSAKRLAS